MSTKRQRDEFDRLEKIIAETRDALEEDDHPEKTGILLSDEIEFYVNQGQLIDPFDRKNLKPAAYELTVGDEAMLGGKPVRLSDCWPKNSLTIPAFEVAVIKTDETLNLPRFLIGRWNIRVAWAYKGLVWVGAPQVDPGYVGHLFCPIYNLSNKEVQIKKGEAIAVMDFVKTTKFDRNRGEEKWKKYQRPPTRVIIEDYGIDDFRSGPFEQALEIPKLKKALEDGLKDVQKRIDGFTTLVFLVLAILMTAVALPYFGVQNTRLDPQILDGLTLSLSLFVLLLSLFGWWFPRIVKPSAALTVIGALALLATIIFCVFWIISPALSALGMYLMDCCSS